MSSPTQDSTQRVGLGNTFSALQHRNYRVWFFGQLVSLVGTWMQTTAQGYLVYELTGSPAFLGYVGFVSGLPAWLFTLYGGLVADRVSPRRTLLITQSSMMLLAFVLAGLVFTGQVQPWHILVLATGLGVANAFDAPARQVFVFNLVDRRDLTNAIALNSTMINAGTVVGPAVAGLVYDWVGPAWCFTINGISFIAVITALARIKIKPPPPAPRQGSTLAALKEGLAFAAGHSAIRTLTAGMVMISMFGMSMMTLLPAWSVDILGGGVRTNGLLLSARGVGSLSGALIIATLSHLNLRGKLWSTGSFIMPAAIIGFALTRWLPLSLVMMVGVGWGFMIQANTANSMVQTQVPDTLRGRVMSLYMLTFFGGMPLGALLAGTLATYLGAPTAVLINAGFILLFAGFVWLRIPAIRRLP